MDQEAIYAIQNSVGIDQASNAVGVAMGSNQGVVALPEDFKQHDLESFMATRRRMRGQMNTSVLADFTAYTTKNAEAGAAVFINPDHMQATAVLNLGTPDEPGHCDNAATLKLNSTAAYNALRTMVNNGCVSQLKAAEFLEDWPEHVQCFNDKGELPTPKAIAGVRRITIENYRKSETQEQSLSASKSAFESVQVNAFDTLPTLIYFKCVPYQELEERLFVLRLGVQTGSDKPTITLRIVKAELHQEEMAGELANKVREALKKFPVHIGTYQAR